MTIVGPVPALATRLAWRFRSGAWTRIEATGLYTFSGNGGLHDAAWTVGAPVAGGRVHAFGGLRLLRRWRRRLGDVQLRRLRLRGGAREQRVVVARPAGPVVGERGGEVAVDMGDAELHGRGVRYRG